ncbi:Fatty-acid and retinol-binding protein 1 [Toxocara canis]|uniref:Fatty-acid and retinol-binding protein 1 n=1 Tax=Toxocara canis TaxID=6265 RepID=A0A0B2UVX0_TOXCA|nr:Fatty-acid and retinol-binding protein 1 [Toxocara canis]
MLLKFAPFFAPVLLICASSPVNKLASSNGDDESVVDTVSDFTLAVMQALTDTFGRFLPDELVDFVHTLSSKDVRTIQTIWDQYADNKDAAYDEILAKIKELNPSLMARIQKLYDRIADKISQLPEEARKFAIKTVFRFDPLLIDISEENIINTAAEVYLEYIELSQSAKDAIVQQFPFVAEIAKAHLFEDYILKQTKAPMRTTRGH